MDDPKANKTKEKTAAKLNNESNDVVQGKNRAENNLIAYLDVSNLLYPGGEFKLFVTINGKISLYYVQHC